MYFLFLLFSLVSHYVSTAHAIPISSQCTNTEIRQSWFLGECLTGQDSTTRIKSAVYLANKVANDDGDLKWKADGSYDSSCSECSLIEGGATLNCSCKTAWGSKKGSRVAGTINLDEHISLYDGHLLSNLSGTPTPPSSLSNYPIPSSFSYSFGGTAHCFEPSDSNKTTTCPWNVPCSDTSNSGWMFDGPITCYAPVIYFPIHHQFANLKIVGDGAWEVLAYDNEVCAGEPMGVVRPEDKGVCKGFERLAKAVTVRPAFNGDPQ
ncbi:Cyanovirin-N [Zopfia rhizophila CBS 207.26]|uniref:Cyanovirin-N n=1 Tax=Zopfia rhizophila CBS 207.26 TaxID=1314779 RepID=A0A6A6DJ21_9PEZI|nr:Cyanovirin-N [Zopfia rhizophila CBS 207.26]